MALLALVSLANALPSDGVYGGLQVPSEYALDSVFFGGDDVEEGVVTIQSGSDSDSESSSSRMKTKHADLEDVSYIGSCGGRFDKPGGISDSAPSYIDRRQKGLVDDYMRQARRYGDKVRAILIGDSIMENMNEADGCEDKIFRSVRGQGFNWGIGGIRTDFVKTIVEWIWSANHGDLTPQVVYLAVGVNDCIYDEGHRNIASNIIDIVKLIKYYSPGTHVVVQSVLPAAYGDDDNFEGEDFDSDSSDIYTCITETNRIVKDWVDDNIDRCIDHADLTDVVLDSRGRFKDGILEDGLHFDTDDGYDAYCREIGNIVEDYHGVSISSSNGNIVSNWADVNPIHYPGLEGNETFYRWSYNEWSNCTGACGTQRRTAECHLVGAETGIGYTVAEAHCSDVFMNPLERLCNLQPSCEAELGPLSARIRQPVPSNSILLPRSNVAGAEVACESPLESGKWVYLGIIIALATTLVGVLVLLACMWRKAGKQQQAGHAQSGSKEADVSRVEAAKV